MGPRTKIHFEVMALKNKLPAVTHEHEEWAYRKLFKFWAYKTKHKAVCFECGHAWNIESNLITRLFPFECPACGKKLEMTEGKSWRKEEIDHFQIMTICGRFQVIRVFCINHYCKKGYHASYSCLEIYQHWISPEGKLVILALSDNHMGGWHSGYTCWCWGSSMEIRNERDKYFINGVKMYPKKKILPIIRRNGWRGDFCKLNPAYLFQLILIYPMAETLMKTGQRELLRIFERNEYRISMYWNQIKICIRNNYMVSDPDMWFDHLELLKYFHKDIHNAKFICPVDLRAEHQKLIDKKQAILDKEKYDEIQRTITEDNKDYVKKKGKFFDLKFTDGVINVVMLNSVKEFYLEGKELHHCVFSNKYYKKADTLIFSARKDDKRLETLELSLKDMHVIQSQGSYNKDSKYHKDIIKLVENNVGVIKQAKRKRKPALVE